MSEIETLVARFDGHEYPINVLKSDQLVAEGIRRHGMWESWLADLMHKILKPGDICCDVGANIGLHTILMSKDVGDGRILAFEPIPITADLLDTNLKSHNCDNVDVHRVALSNENSEIRLILNEEMLGNAHVLPTEKQTPTNDPEHKLVEVVAKTRRFDDLVAETGIGRVDVIKVDVEAHENQFFDGAKETIYANPDLLYITEHALSAHSDHSRLGAEEFYISDYEYYRKCSDRFSHCYIIERDHSLSPVENYAMLRLLMMRGRGVEDLFFCDALPASLTDAVSSSQDIDQVPSPISRSFLLPNGMAHSVNRYRDGWAKVGLLKPWCQSGLIVQTAEPVRANFRFFQPPTKHLNGIGKIAINDELHRLDVSKGAQDLEIVCEPGRTSIFVETFGFIVPSQHLASPNDHREIGLRWAVEFSEL